MSEALKNLKVLNDYIIIKPSQQADEEVTTSGLVVPKNPGDPNLVYHYAKVVGIGASANYMLDNDEALHVGDVVYYAQKKASAIAIVEEGYMYDPRKANYAYIKPEDVIAVVREESELKNTHDAVCPAYYNEESECNCPPF
jgi:co-chaperonin GroES (HSP10)